LDVSNFRKQKNVHVFTSPYESTLAVIKVC